MAKKHPGRGFASTSKVIDGHLASSQREANSVLATKLDYDINNQPDLHVVEKESEQSFEYPKTPILDALESYLTNPSVPLHIPAHTNGEAVLPRFKNLVGSKIIKADTTDEFDGLGQLNPPVGAIKEAHDLAAKVFGAKDTFFLINGSSVGNMALALTVSKPGDKIIMARNCHRSVISGITTSGATPVWALPERIDEWGIWGAVKPEVIKEKLLENPDASVVWITNPTYEGIVSDVKSIADICKEHNVTLLVDEAHGCHWNFSDKLPTNALYLGADAVVHSIHKTGGSFSQSSMLHIAENSKVDVDELQSNLSMLQSTSPSYMLLASLDAARAYLDSPKGREKISNIVDAAHEARNKINKIKGCRCLSPGDEISIDPTKIYFTIDGLNGKQIRTILENDFNIETEARTDKGVLALANIGNTSSELEYLHDALKIIASNKHPKHKESVRCMPFSIPEMVCIPNKAYFSKKEKIKPTEAIGRISAEVIAECPPGIPVLVPGEKIQLDHMHYLKNRDFIWVKSQDI